MYVANLRAEKSVRAEICAQQRWLAGYVCQVQCRICTRTHAMAIVMSALELGDQVHWVNEPGLVVDGIVRHVVDDR